MVCPQTGQTVRRLRLERRVSLPAANGCLSDCCTALLPSRPMRPTLPTQLANPRTPSEILRAYSSSGNWAGVTPAGDPSCGCSSQPGLAASLDLQISPASGNAGTAYPRRPASERADGPMNGVGDEGPNHEPPTGSHGAGLNPGRGASSAVMQTVAPGATCPGARCRDPGAGMSRRCVPLVSTAQLC